MANFFFPVNERFSQIVNSDAGNSVAASRFSLATLDDSEQHVSLEQQQLQQQPQQQLRPDQDERQMLKRMSQVSIDETGGHDEDASHRQIVSPGNNMDEGKGV